MMQFFRVVTLGAHAHPCMQSEPSGVAGEGDSLTSKGEKKYFCTEFYFERRRRGPQIHGSCLEGSSNFSQLCGPRLSTPEVVHVAHAATEWILFSVVDIGHDMVFFSSSLTPNLKN